MVHHGPIAQSTVCVRVHGYQASGPWSKFADHKARIASKLAREPPPKPTMPPPPAGAASLGWKNDRKSCSHLLLLHGYSMWLESLLALLPSPLGRIPRPKSPPAIPLAASQAIQEPIIQALAKQRPSIACHAAGQRRPAAPLPYTTKEGRSPSEPSQSLASP